MLHPFSALAGRRAGATCACSRRPTSTCTSSPTTITPTRPNDTMGLPAPPRSSRRSAPRRATRSSIDNGDFLQGNPMGDYIAYERGMKAGDVHPVIAGMNTLGYEVGTLGNHEFNYGLEFLDKVARRRQLPVRLAPTWSGATLAADPRDDDATSQALRHRRHGRSTDGAGAEHPIKIGFIGFVPPQIMIWDAQPPRRQGRHPRHRRDGARPGCRRCARRAPTSSSPSPTPASTPSREPAHARTPRCSSPAVEGIDVVAHRPPALVFPGPRTSRASTGVDIADRHARRQAGGDGRLLGLAYGPDRPAARAATAASGRSSRTTSRRARSTSASTARSSPLVESDADGRSTRSQADHEATLAYVRRAGRRDRGAAPLLLRAGRRRSRRCRS